MYVKAYAPHPLLAEYIDSFLYCAMSDLEMDLIPRGANQVFFLLNERHTATDLSTGNCYGSRFFFSSPATRHYKMLCSELLRSVGVLFKPFGAYRLLGIPQNLLLDNYTDMRDLLGPTIGTLIRQLEDVSDTPDKVVDLLQGWLLMQGRNLARIDVSRMRFACETIQRFSGGMPVAALAREVAMSERNLELHFRTHVGLSPKMYSRIARFSCVKEAIVSRRNPDWAEVAYGFNYSDQTHFIKEFKRFYGHTPSHYEQRKQDLADLR